MKPKLRNDRRSDSLPKKFTEDERIAYDWLFDCDIRPWFVDLGTKEVTTINKTYSSLVEYAKKKGMA
jgi:hypothetical protein